MDARRRAAAKVGTLARCATQQPLQLAQPNKTASLLRDWSAFVPIAACAVFEIIGHSDVELHELLNVYVDTAHLAEHTDGAAPHPLENVLDVMQAMRALFIALGLVSRRLNDDSRTVI